VPLVLGPDGARLAKRHGSSGRTESESSAEALALLAASVGIRTGSAPPRRAADLLGGFDPALIPREPLRLH
jgi:glutamyl-tRNA synthetase